MWFKKPPEDPGIDVVKLENGNTVLVNKWGNVVNNLGGGDAPKSIVRAVNGLPVTGYTIVAGDDDYLIAQKNGITKEELRKLNPDVKDWNNLQPGQALNIPMEETEAFTKLLEQTEGGKSLTDTSIQKLDKGLTVLGQLGTLQSNIEGLKTGPIVGAFKSANPWDTQAQTIKASLNAIVPNLARGVYGEVGVLTDNDIATYSRTIPNLKSTEEVRNAVLYITLDMIGKSIKNTLSVNAAAGRDVSGFVDIYTEMESAKNSILEQIPSAQVPGGFKQEDDDWLNQFSTKSLSNSDFFNKLP
jgi:LysM repeat protein